jgi:F-type H+-transporting ATPase subunit delta
MYTCILNINNLQVLIASVPGRYAKALFIAAKKKKCIDKILEGFKILEILFAEYPYLKKFLTNRFLSKNDLENCWKALEKKCIFCPTFNLFIRLLFFNKRFEIINMIQYIYCLILSKYKGIREVFIHSYINLSSKQKKSIENIVTKVIDEKVIINYVIDKRILGGIKILSEEIVIDATVVSQLHQVIRYLTSI